MNRPTLEERLDAFDIVRQPRAVIVPGLVFAAGMHGIMPLRCPQCGRSDAWFFHPKRALILCVCQL